MAGKKIRRGRREQEWREKRFGFVKKEERNGGKKIRRGRREKDMAERKIRPTYSYDVDTIPYDTTGYDVERRPWTMIAAGQ